jgi:hypothetical protein
MAKNPDKAKYDALLAQAAKLISAAVQTASEGKKWVSALFECRWFHFVMCNFQVQLPQGRTVQLAGRPPYHFSTPAERKTEYDGSLGYPADAAFVLDDAWKVSKKAFGQKWHSLLLRVFPDGTYEAEHNFDLNKELEKCRMERSYH